MRRTGVPLRARIGANESPFGPAPSVLAAMRAAAAESWHYGDPENHDLRAAIANHLGVGFANVMPGEGVDAILGMAVRLYAAPGSTVVTSLGGYPTFNYHIAGYGAHMHTVPYVGDREDIDALARAARDTNAAMVYLANPDNPMGSWWDAASVERFITAVPGTTMIILDEAYGEFAPPGTLPALDMARPNLLRMRTFSKAYGQQHLGLQPHPQPFRHQQCGAGRWHSRAGRRCRLAAIPRSGTGIDRGHRGHCPSPWTASPADGDQFRGGGLRAGRTLCPGHSRRAGQARRLRAQTRSDRPQPLHPHQRWHPG
jgi:hypothetical protein